ncbi:enoyl-CoA hydratase/isomerase family protein [Microbacteriaceae bacterium K1510]|nr:enoyl-CoA hydratase/isomerase family protein [Microbacteriaceae bacterium K1510]
MTDVIQSKRDGAVVAVTIDRAADGNQLTLPMVRDLANAIREAGKTDAKVITLRSTGSEFCLGRDTRGGPPPGPPPSALQMRTNLIAPLLDVYDAIGNAAQPVVASVQGAARGFGCALATACDVSIASASATFALPEMEKNLPPTLAISAMMSRVPQKVLTWLVYSMKDIGAEEALRYGLVSHVVAPDKLVSESNDFVAELCTRSRDAVVAVKDYLRVAPGLPMRTAADLAGNTLATVFSSRSKE